MFVTLLAESVLMFILSLQVPKLRTGPRYSTKDKIHTPRFHVHTLTPSSSCIVFYLNSGCLCHDRRQQEDLWRAGVAVWQAQNAILSIFCHSSRPSPKYQLRKTHDSV